MSNKTMKYGIMAAVFAIVLVLGMGAFLCVGATPVEFEKKGYTCVPGESVDMKVTLDYTALNTTVDDIKDGGYWDGSTWVPFSDDDLSNQTDFDADTGTNVSVLNEGGIICSAPQYYDPIGDGYLDYNITPVASFDGIWIDKSIGLSLEFAVMNNTAGMDSWSYVDFENGEYMFPYTIERGYKLISELSPDGGIYAGICAKDGNRINIGGMTFAQWVAEYGMIDHIEISLSIDSGVVSPCYLNEWHLFNLEPTIASYQITDGDYNYMVAWPADATRESAGIWTLTVNVPKNAPEGNYFVVVEDNEGNYADTTLSVNSNQISAVNWLIPIGIFITGVVLVVIADILADTKTNAIAVAVFAIVGVLICAVAVYISLNWLHVSLLGFSFLIPGIVLFKKENREALKAGIIKNKKYLTLGLVAIVLCSAFAGAAMARTSASPESQTVKPGDSFAITVYSDASHSRLNDTNVYATINKQDNDGGLQYAVIWHYTVNAADDNLSAVVTFHTVDSVPAGTYQIHIYTIEMVGQVGVYATVYVQGSVFDWSFFYIFFLGGILLSVIAIFGYIIAQKTKTKFDDGAFILLGILGVVLVVLSLAQYFGYLSAWGLSGALSMLKTHLAALFV